MASSNIVLLFGTALIMWFAKKLGYPFINVPVFALGVWSSESSEVRILKTPSAYWLLMLLGILYGISYLICSDAHAIHGVINCAFVAMSLIIIQLLPTLQNGNSTTRILAFVVPATYMLYLTHHKVLSFMVWEWGYVSFPAWAFAVIIVTVLFTLLQKLLKI